MRPPTLEEARAALTTRLGKATFAHSEAVAETAARLAREYGVDPDAARMAGLLHDWCKECGDEELLAAAALHGIDVTVADRARPRLLHARVAAAELRETFPGLPTEVVHAVEAHTFGDDHMDDLARVVYVADMIEPGRTHRGVHELRSSVGRVPLHELMLAACAMTMRHVIDSRRPLHPDSVGTWNALVLAEPRKA